MFVLLLSLMSQNAASLGTASQGKRDLAVEDMGDYLKTCQQQPVEFAFVIDSSSSIHPSDFRKGQNFLIDFLSGYDIGPGKVRVAAVTFGQGVYKENSFNLNTYQDKESVLEAVRKMPHRAGSTTDTFDAIKYMREKQMVVTRPGVPKVCIVVTDGESRNTTRTAYEAEQARSRGITMYAVGVGPKVNDLELRNIAGDETRVLKANNYDALLDLKDLLAFKTCVIEEKTTQPPMTQPCSVKHPSDINFIFSPAALGIDATGWVTQFISHTITNEELESGFQYGMVCGSCPADAGFPLNEYSNVADIRARLDSFDRNNLPNLISRATALGYSTQNGGRPNASKVAVVFLGKSKVDQRQLVENLREMVQGGVKVFVSRTDPGIPASLPAGVRVLDEGSSFSQATEFVNLLCNPEES